MKKARNDVVLILLFTYLLSLTLLLMGFEPTAREVAILIAGVGAVVCGILLRAVRQQDHRST